MALPIIKLKNNDSVNHTWTGQLLEPVEEIIVNDYFALALLANDSFLADLSIGDAVILRDGTVLNENEALRVLAKQILISEIISS